MEVNNSKVKKNSLVAAVLFAIACIIYAFLLIKDFDTGTKTGKILRGSLTVLFAILAVQNYLKYKRAQD